MEDDKKRVDEAWKEAIEKEKETLKSGASNEEVEVSFGLFINGLLIEGLIALGDMESPISKKKEENLVHAKYIIDMLGILQEKTKGNLTDDESKFLDSILYELRMRYLGKTTQKKE